MKGRTYYLTVDVREDSGWGRLDSDRLDDYEEFLRGERVIFEREGPIFTYWGYDVDDLADIVMLQQEILAEDDEEFTYEDALDYVEQWGGNTDEEDDDFTYGDLDSYNDDDDDIY